MSKFRLRALSIVLAEDNVDHAELMADTLATLNPANSITHITNGEELILNLSNRIAEQIALPDLIIMDIKMPRMNGIEALYEIKRQPELKSIPVVMVTTSCNKTEIETCFTLGASSFVTKPLDYQEFTEKISSLNGYWAYTSETPVR